MTTLKEKILALEKMNDTDPAYKPAFQALRTELRAHRAAKKAARGEAMGPSDAVGPSGASEARDVNYYDSIYRADYLNIRNDNERGPLGYYINNWTNKDSNWTSSGQSRDDELGDDNIIAVNGLRLRFYVYTDEPGKGIGFIIRNSSTSLSTIAHYTNGWSGSEYQEASRLNSNSYMEWYDDDSDGIVGPYFKFTVLKSVNGIVQIARVDMFSRPEVLAMQVLILWKTNNLYHEIEFRPRYYVSTAVGTGEGYAYLQATGIPDLTMAQIKSQGLWNTSTATRNVLFDVDTELTNADPTRDSLYIRYLHGSFGALPRNF